MRIILDTSVLITSLRSRNGASAEIVELVLTGAITLLMDYKLACEYRDVAMRPKHLQASGLSKEEVNHLIRMLEDFAEPVFVATKYRPMSSDPDDDMILDLGINGDADLIVTNNVRHLRRAAAEFGLNVLTPKEFLQFLNQENRYGPSKE